MRRRRPVSIRTSSTGQGGAGSERELVERAAGGDHDAFRALYEANVAVVFGFARARVGAQVAEDITAETFCKAYEHISRFEWRGVPYRAWLLRIANNLVIGRARRRSSTEIPVDEPADWSSIVEDDPLAGLESQDLLASLARLPARQRAVIELRYLRDLNVAETSAVLDLTEEGVRALTYRALRALRDVYG